MATLNDLLRYDLIARQASLTEIGDRDILMRAADEIERLRAILMNVALAIGADDSPTFAAHIGHEQSAKGGRDGL